MNYISLDLEFNSAFDFQTGRQAPPNPNCHHEIIQIGAVKFDEEHKFEDTFNAYIKPRIYPRINPFIAEVIKMKTEDFKNAGSFSDNYREFKKFSGDGDITFIVWGGSDIPILYENIVCYRLIDHPLILRYIDIQPYISRLLGEEHGKQISLKKAIETLGIETDLHCHNALYDAYYTAKIFIKTLKDCDYKTKIFCSNHYKNMKIQ